MKSPWHFPISASLIALVCLSSPVTSSAVLGLFEKDDKGAPPPEVIAQQEEEAKKLLAEAQKLSNQGRFGKARDVHEKIVKNYPLTQTAAVSQFAIGESLESEGDLIGAFNAYQVFVQEYVHQERFAEAISRQFRIAEQAKDAKASTVLRVFRTKTQPSKQVEMFRKIATNAPYSEFAADSLYNVGLIEHEAGHPAEALSALQEVLDNYPKDPIAKEAALKMIEIRQNRKTRDDSHIERTQIEMEKFLYDHGDDPRAADMRNQVTELNERDAKKKLEIAQYYQKKKSYRAAAIYFQAVPRGSKVYPEAQKGLDAIAKIDPNLIQSPSAPKKRIVAETQVTQNPEYVGPPAPRLKAPWKPKMRVSEEELKPIPVE